MVGHTDKEYEAELDQLHQQLLLMGARVEDQLSKSLTAYSDSDVALAKEAIASDLTIDELELEIDRHCLQLLARRQPLAKDLRFVTLALKVVTDLERIGDLAKNVGRRVVQLADLGPPPPEQLLIEMGVEARVMLHDAMDSFVQENARKAEAVVQQDKEVDKRYDKLLPQVSGRVAGRPGEVEQLMHVVSIAKGFERIADHATNIAEMVIFLVEGDDVRHVRAKSRAKLKTEG